jgi:DNA polymerase-3 subunit delta'
MIETLKMDENIKKIIKNLSIEKKESGTYLLYGNDKKELLEVAMVFGKILTCKNKSNDFCGKCESCIRMESGTHGDLEILREEAGGKINDIREMIGKMSVTSYEGGNRIFILEGIEKMSTTSLNALLKTIEEPNNGNYFFLLTTTLNILSTIKSRSSLVKILPRTSYELGVDEQEYNFFAGKTRDILEYKQLKDKNEDLLNSKRNYLEIEKIVEEYSMDPEIKNKIELYHALRIFVNEINFINDLEKIFVLEGIVRGSKENKEILFLILNYLAFLNSENLKIEKILEVKNMLHSPLNTSSCMLRLIL